MNNLDHIYSNPHIGPRSNLISSRKLETSRLNNFMKEIRTIKDYENNDYLNEFNNNSNNSNILSPSISSSSLLSPLNSPPSTYYNKNKLLSSRIHNNSTSILPSIKSKYELDKDNNIKTLTTPYELKYALENINNNKNIQKPLFITNPKLGHSISTPLISIEKCLLNNQSTINANNNSIIAPSNPRILTSLGFIDVNSPSYETTINNKYKFKPQPMQEAIAAAYERNKLDPIKPVEIKADDSINQKSKSPVRDEISISFNTPANFDVYMGRLDCMDVDFDNVKDKEFVQAYAYIHKYRVKKQQLEFEAKKARHNSISEKISTTYVETEPEKQQSKTEKSNYLNDLKKFRNIKIAESNSKQEFDYDTPRNDLVYNKVNEKIQSVKSSPYVIIDGNLLLLRKESDFKQWLSSIFDRSDTFKSSILFFPVKLAEVFKSLEHMPQDRPNILYMMVNSLVLFWIFNEPSLINNYDDREFGQQLSIAIIRSMYRGFSNTFQKLVENRKSHSIICSPKGSLKLISSASSRSISQLIVEKEEQITDQVLMSELIRGTPFFVDYYNLLAELLPLRAKFFRLENSIRSMIVGNRRIQCRTYYPEREAILIYIFRVWKSRVKNWRLLRLKLRFAMNDLIPKTYAVPQFFMNWRRWARARTAQRLEKELLMVSQRKLTNDVLDLDLNLFFPDELDDFDFNMRKICRKYEFIVDIKEDDYLSKFASNSSKVVYKKKYPIGIGWRLEDDTNVFHFTGPRLVNLELGLFVVETTPKTWLSQCHALFLDLLSGIQLQLHLQSKQSVWPSNLPKLIPLIFGSNYLPPEVNQKYFGPSDKQVFNYTKFNMSPLWIERNQLLFTQAFRFRSYIKFSGENHRSLLIGHLGELGWHHFHAHNLYTFNSNNEFNSDTLIDISFITPYVEPLTATENDIPNLKFKLELAEPNFQFIKSLNDILNSDVKVPFYSSQYLCWESIHVNESYRTVTSDHFFTNFPELNYISNEENSRYSIHPIPYYYKSLSHFINDNHLPAFCTNNYIPNFSVRECGNWNYEALSGSINSYKVHTSNTEEHISPLDVFGNIENTLELPLLLSKLNEANEIKANKKSVPIKSSITSPITNPTSKTSGNDHKKFKSSSPSENNEFNTTDFWAKRVQQIQENVPKKPDCCLIIKEWVNSLLVQNSTITSPLITLNEITPFMMIALLKLLFPVEVECDIEIVRDLEQSEIQDLVIAYSNMLEINFGNIFDLAILERSEELSYCLLVRFYVIYHSNEICNFKNSTYYPISLKCCLEEVVALDKTLEHLTSSVSNIWNNFVDRSDLFEVSPSLFSSIIQQIILCDQHAFSLQSRLVEKFDSNSLLSVMIWMITDVSHILIHKVIEQDSIEEKLKLKAQETDPRKPHPTKTIVDFIDVNGLPFNIFDLQIKNVSEAERILLNNVIINYYSELRNLFRFYSKSNAINATDWNRFLTESGCIDKVLTYQNASISFVQAKKFKTGGNSLGAAEFVEALIYVADKKYSKAESSLSGRFIMFCQNFVLEDSSQSVGMYFKNLVASQSIKDIFTTHENALKEIFTYAAAGAARKGQGIADDASSISEPEFLQFCKDFKLTTSTLAHSKQAVIFAKIQADEGDTAEDKECSFDEFQEAIAAMAVFYYPNNYISLAIRLQQFLVRVLYPVAINDLKIKGFVNILKNANIKIPGIDEKRATVVLPKKLV